MYHITYKESLSARRAWIEIQIYAYSMVKVLSLSARRAWIEIASRWQATAGRKVALRKESVDRNTKRTGKIIKFSGRSPQGERG